VLAPLAWLALYLPALDYPFAWTDEGAIAGGTLLRPAGETLAAFGEPLHRIGDLGGGVHQAYYRPLPVAVLSLVDQNLPREPRSFRLFTIVFGALCVSVFGLFATWLLQRPGPALFAALFVALHPVGIEATVWIAGLPAAICAIFAIGVVALGVRAARAATPGQAALYGLLSTAALCLGLLSKERAAVAPALLVAALLSLGRAPRRVAAVCLVGVQAVVVAAYVFALRPAVLGSAFAGLPPLGGRTSTQTFTAIATWPAQLGWLFAPLHSSTSDAVWLAESAGEPRVWLGALLALGSLAAWFLLRRVGARVAALGLAWIWIAYAPTSGLMPMLHQAGERYLFLSAFGVALLLGGLGAHWVPAGSSPGRRVPAAAAAVLMLVFLGERSHARIPDWSSTRRLFERDVTADPAYREAYFVLGAEALEEKRFGEAEKWIAPLLANDPRFEGNASYVNWLSLAAVACGARLGLGDYDGILELGERWKREFASLARTPTVRICLGRANDGLGRTRVALEIYQKVAVEFGAAAAPDLALLIARDLLELGRPKAARQWLAQARQVAAHDPSLLSEVRLLAAELDHAQRANRRQQHP